MEEKSVKRKGYKTLQQQYAATKRYLENNPEAKEKRKIAVAKSQAKKFINDYANKEDLQELKTLILEKEKNI